MTSLVDEILFSDPAVDKFSANVLKDFLMTSLVILSCGSGFKILAGVSRLIPSSSGHLSYFPMANALNGLPQLKSGA